MKGNRGNHLRSRYRRRAFIAFSVINSINRCALPKAKRDPLWCSFEVWHAKETYSGDLTNHQQIELIALVDKASLLHNLINIIKICHSRLTHLLLLACLSHSNRRNLMWWLAKAGVADVRLWARPIPQHNPLLFKFAASRASAVSLSGQSHCRLCRHHYLLSIFASVSPNFLVCPYIPD